MTRRDRIADIWGERTPHGADDAWPVRVDMSLEDGLTETDVERWVQSACVLCSNGCACDIAVKDRRIVGVRGRAIDRVNRGRLGPKGLHGWQANNSADRLTTPLLRRNGKLVEASWDEAMELVVARSSQVKESHGSGALAIYNTGQLLLEEYYTLAVMADAGLGTPHIDGNTRLCTATAAMAYIQSFGTDGHPGSYTDFDVTDAMFIVGNNPANTATVLWA